MEVEVAGGSARAGHDGVVGPPLLRRVGAVDAHLVLAGHPFDGELLVVRIVLITDKVVDGTFRRLGELSRCGAEGDFVAADGQLVGGDADLVGTACQRQGEAGAQKEFRLFHLVAFEG